MAVQLLVDTRAKPKHCAFIAYLEGNQQTGVVRYSQCCAQCLKALVITLRINRMGHLRIRRD